MSEHDLPQHIRSAANLVAHYEALRHERLAQDQVGSAHACAGLTLLLRAGLAAWIRSASTLAPTSRSESPAPPRALFLSPDGLANETNYGQTLTRAARGELTRLVVSMAMGQLKEQLA